MEQFQQFLYDWGLYVVLGAGVLIILLFGLWLLAMRGKSILKQKNKQLTANNTEYTKQIGQLQEENDALRAAHTQAETERADAEESKRQAEAMAQAQAEAAEKARSEAAARERAEAAAVARAEAAKRQAEAAEQARAQAAARERAARAGAEEKERLAIQVQALKQKQPQAKVAEEDVTVVENDDKTPTVYSVKYDRYKGNWIVVKTGQERPVRRVATKEEALRIAKDLAKRMDAALVVHKKDGKFQKI